MRQDFIKIEDLENISSSDIFKTKYSRITDIGTRKKLQLECDELQVGNEVFVGVEISEQTFRVISAVIKGYKITTDFSSYDDESGNVNTLLAPIFLGEDGQRYDWEDIVTSICDNKSYAQDQLKEMVNDWYENPKIIE